MEFPIKHVKYTIRHAVNAFFTVRVKALPV